MSRRLFVAAAMAALTVAAAPAAAQVRAVNPQPVQPVQPVSPALPQVSTLELQMEINELTAAVEQMSERLNTLNQHIASLSGQLGTLAEREQEHYAELDAKIYLTCRMLYVHVHGDTPENQDAAKQVCQASGWQLGL